MEVNAKQSEQSDTVTDVASDPGGQNQSPKTSPNKTAQNEPRGKANSNNRRQSLNSTEDRGQQQDRRQRSSTNTANSGNDRRRGYVDYRRRISSKSFSHDNNSTTTAPVPIVKAQQKAGPRSHAAKSLDDHQQQQAPRKQEAYKAWNKNRSSTTGTDNGRQASSYSINSNGSNIESFDYDDMGEPFTDSEDDSESKGVQKPSLIIARGRIRTLSGTIPPCGFCPKWGGPTMCLSCLQFFNLPEMIGDFSIHLLTHHNIVIAEIELIVDLKRYVEYWRQRFTKESIDKVFPKIDASANADDSYNGQVEYYFYMSDSIQEDFELRQRLAMRRLQEALSCQQREREENTFTMECLFCRYTARGNRAKLIHHLYMIHHLNLGSPDNMVFVYEYIEHLHEKMKRNECIYCEKTFADHNVLMEHMRRKSHREVNPKNSYYDKFYIINYLELGKRWLDVIAEDFEDTMPTFVDSDEEEEGDAWKEWQEEEADDDRVRAVCLYCEFSTEVLSELLEHTKLNHSVDLIEYFAAEGMGTYERMKFLNYVRKEKFNSPPVRADDANQKKIVELPDRGEWDKEEHLIPMFGNDHLPWLIESHLLEKELAEDVQKNGKGSSSAEPSVFDSIVKESKASTVDGVIPEDLPDMTLSVLADKDLCESLQ